MVENENESTDCFQKSLGLQHARQDSKLKIHRSIYISIAREQEKRL